MKDLTKGLLLKFQNGHFGYVREAGERISKITCDDGSCVINDNADDIAVDIAWDMSDANNVFNYSGREPVYIDGAWRDTFYVRVTYNGEESHDIELREDDKGRIIVKNGKVKSFDGDEYPNKSSIRSLQDFMLYVGAPWNDKDVFRRFNSVWSTDYNKKNGYEFAIFYE